MTTRRPLPSRFQSWSHSVAGVLLGARSLPQCKVFDRPALAIFCTVSGPLKTRLHFGCFIWSWTNETCHPVCAGREGMRPRSWSSCPGCQTSTGLRAGSLSMCRSTAGGGVSLHSRPHQAHGIRLRSGFSSCATQPPITTQRRWGSQSIRGNR